MNILFCAPHFGMVPQTLPLQLTQPRHPYGTQELLLSAATFLSWHGSQIPVAWDPNVNATYKGQLHRRQTSDWHHPCCSGLQVQGTAISPAARKLYNIFQHMVSPCLFIIPRKRALCQAKPSLLSSAFIGCFQLPFSIRLRLSIFIQQCHHFLRQLPIGTASILVRQISWSADHPIVFSFPAFVFHNACVIFKHPSFVSVIRRHPENLRKLIINRYRHLCLPDIIFCYQ